MSVPVVRFQVDPVGVPVVLVPGASFTSFVEAHVWLDQLRDGLLAAEAMWMREAHPSLDLGDA